MSVEIKQHQPGKDLKDFIQVAFEVYRDDPAWVPPLHMEITDRLTPEKNPFFEHAEVALFTAWKDGKAVGRISAQIDHEHLRIHEDNAGFFGFFDTVDDQEVASALIAAAEDWLASRGMTVMRGPFSLSINEETGLLVEGFDSPPTIMSPHHRSYQGALAEAAGLQKVKDCYGWKHQVVPAPARAQRAWEAITSLPEVRFRSVSPRNLKKEVRDILDVFNDAWQHNWGFVPATDAEAKKMAADLLLILDKELSFFAEIDGQPVAICVCLPNLNEVIFDFGGKLNPVTVGKLIWRLKIRGPKSARLMLLGIRTDLRGKRRYAPLAMAVIAELVRRGLKQGYEWAELGWTLEDNGLINAAIRSMGATIYKRYRLFEKPIGA
jgi:GNAT superfamily N-acetyltransferase